MVTGLVRCVRTMSKGKLTFVRRVEEGGGGRGEALADSRVGRLFEVCSRGKTLVCRTNIQTHQGGKIRGMNTMQDLTGMKRLD